MQILELTSSFICAQVKSLPLSYYRKNSIEILDALDNFSQNQMKTREFTFEKKTQSKSRANLKAY